MSCFMMPDWVSFYNDSQGEIIYRMMPMGISNILYWVLGGMSHTMMPRETSFISFLGECLHTDAPGDALSNNALGQCLIQRCTRRMSI